MSEILTVTARGQLGPALGSRSGLRFGLRVPRDLRVAQCCSRYLLVVCQRGPGLNGRPRLLLLPRQVVPRGLRVAQYSCRRSFAPTICEDAALGNSWMSHTMTNEYEMSVCICNLSRSV